MMRLLGKLILSLMGWKLEGDDPGRKHKKLIYIVMPHTSNWDFFIGISAKWILPMNIKWLGKDALFRWPYGWFFRSLDGMPVVRNKNLKLVDRIIETFKNTDELRIVIPIEGTRGPVDRIKTGFYHISQKANVPVSFLKINADVKTLFFTDVVEMTGDWATDLKMIHDYYKDAKGMIPENGYMWNQKA